MEQELVEISCKRCGSTELDDKGDYFQCQNCNTKFIRPANKEITKIIIEREVIKEREILPGQEYYRIWYTDNSGVLRTGTDYQTISWSSSSNRTDINILNGLTVMPKDYVPQNGESFQFTSTDNTTANYSVSNVITGNNGIEYISGIV